MLTLTVAFKSILKIPCGALDCFEETVAGMSTWMIQYIFLPITILLICRWRNSKAPAKLGKKKAPGKYINVRIKTMLASHLLSSTGVAKTNGSLHHNSCFFNAFCQYSGTYIHACKYTPPATCGQWRRTDLWKSNVLVCCLFEAPKDGTYWMLGSVWFLYVTTMSLGNQLSSDSSCLHSVWTILLYELSIIKVLQNLTCPLVVGCSTTPPHNVFR